MQGSAIGPFLPPANDRLTPRGAISPNTTAPNTPELRIPVGPHVVRHFRCWLEWDLLPPPSTPPPPPTDGIGCFRFVGLRRLAWPQLVSAPMGYEVHTSLHRGEGSSFRSSWPVRFGEPCGAATRSSATVTIRPLWHVCALAPAG